MTNDTVIVLLLADLQREVLSLRAENAELRAENERLQAASVDVDANT